MAELGIEHIKAVTPQAKGRVERLWLTLQDHLVIVMRLLGITSMEEANAALPPLIEKRNKQFAIAPRSDELAYMELRNDVQLDHVFTIREFRVLGSGNTISYAGTIYTLVEPSPQRFVAKTVVEVRQTLSGEVFIWHHEQALLAQENRTTFAREKE
jgi:hypothetical protein